MKFKLIPTERRIARQFKPERIEITQAESEMKRLIQLSKEKFKGRAILATLNFDDESGNGYLTSQPVSFDEDTSLNLSYFAMQMLEERYAGASQELKDQFLNQLYEDLAGEEEPLAAQEEMETPERNAPPRAPLKECVSCGEEISASMVYCPYCGESQTQPAAPRIEKEASFFPEKIVATPTPLPEKNEPLEIDFSGDFLSELQTLITKQVALNRSKIETQISEQTKIKKEQAQKEKEAELAKNEQEELDAARKVFQAKEKEIQERYAEKRQTERAAIETSCTREMAQRVAQEQDRQEQQGEQLLAQLTQFLVPLESS